MPHERASESDRNSLVGRSRRRLRAGAMLAMVALSTVGSASADITPAGGPTNVERRRVMVRATGEIERVEPFIRSLRELLGRLNVDVDMVRVGELAEASAPTRSPPLLAVVSVDLARDDAVVVIVSDGLTGREQARRTLDGAGSSQLTVEAAAHVTQFAVEDLLEAERTPAPSPPPDVRALPAPPSRTPRDQARPSHAARADDGIVGLDVGAFAVGRRLGGGASAALGGGLWLAPRLTRTTARPAVWVSGAYHAPVEVDGSYVRLQANMLSLRAVPALTVLRDSTWAVEAGAGAGADVLFSASRSSDVPASRLAGDRTDAAPVLSAVVMSHFAVARTAGITLALMLDMDVAPRRYIGRIAGEEEIVFSPSRFRPSLALGFTFSAFGQAAFPPPPGARP